MTKFLISVCLGFLLSHAFPSYFLQPVSNALVSGLSKQEVWGLHDVMTNYFFSRAIAFEVTLFSVYILFGVSLFAFLSTFFDLWWSSCRLPAVVRLRCRFAVRKLTELTDEGLTRADLHEMIDNLPSPALSR